MAKITYVSRPLNSLISGIIGGKVTAPTAAIGAGAAAAKLTSEGVNVANTLSLTSNLHSAIGGLTWMAWKKLPGGTPLALSSAVAQIRADLISEEGKIKNTSLSNLASAITGIGGGAALVAAGPAALAVGVGLLGISTALGIAALAL